MKNAQKVARAMHIDPQQMREIMAMQNAHSAQLMDAEQGIGSVNNPQPYETMMPVSDGPEQNVMMHASYETMAPQHSPRPEEEPLLDVMPDKLSFNQAFAQARRGGLLTFMWRGNKFNTKVK